MTGKLLDRIDQLQNVARALQVENEELKNRACEWLKVGSQWYDTSCGMQDESERDRKVYCGGCGGRILVKEKEPKEAIQ